MKAPVPVNILSLVNINLGAVNRRPNLMLMEAGMRNSQVAKIICEQHSSEVIFAIAIQVISFVLGQGKANIIHMDEAMRLMQYFLDANGVEVAAIIANDKTKA